MKSLRAVTAAAVIVVGMAAVPAKADDRGLPLESAFVEEDCLQAARLADSTSCTVQATASAPDGAVSAYTRLVSPGGGTVPWDGLAGAYGGVTVNHRVDTPVRELQFEITVRVNQARVSVTPGLSGLAGWYVNALHSGNAVHVNAGASALHGSCSDCAGGTGVIVLAAHRPGATETVSDRDVVFRVRVSRKGGVDMPPGVVTVRPSVGVTVWQSGTWGDDSGSVDAVITKVALV